ncbi:hypothetical protein HTT03_09730 [Sulfitobacter sp. S0837]|nr:hypothetical protein [Sulfitobacter maritimus]
MLCVNENVSISGSTVQRFNGSTVQRFNGSTVLRNYCDVIFAGGDMVRANMIFQDNVVIDENAMRVIGNGAKVTAATLGGHRTGTH